MPEELACIIRLCHELEVAGAPRKHLVAGLLSTAIVLMQADGFDENGAATLTRDTIHIAYTNRPEGHH